DLDEDVGMILQAAVADLVLDAPLPENLHCANPAAARFGVIGCGRALLDDDGVNAEAIKQKAHREPDRSAADDEDRGSAHSFGGRTYRFPPCFVVYGETARFSLSHKNMFDMVPISIRDGRTFMDLRQLRYFVAVAERGGFGAAANALNVAQSALSRHVRELEHELGGALLERGARGVSVTEAGKVLLARGRWLLGAVDDIKEEARTENREPSGTVRLGAPSSLADNFYAPLADYFMKKFPRVRLELSEGLTETMSDRVLRAEL